MLVSLKPAARRNPATHWGADIEGEDPRQSVARIDQNANFGFFGRLTDRSKIHIIGKRLS